MASSVNNNGHTGIHLGRGSTLSLADVRVEHGQVSTLPNIDAPRHIVPAMMLTMTPD